MVSKLVAVDGGLHLPTAVRNQLTADLQADMAAYMTDAENAALAADASADAAASDAAAAAASAAAATAIVTADLDEANALLIADTGSDTHAALLAFMDSGARVVPVWYASGWPARPSVDTDDVVLWIGNPGGTAPPGMLAQDIWTRSPGVLDGVWQPYTPVLSGATTNPVLGTGASVVGRYVRTGNTVTGWASFTFGTGFTGGSGTWSVNVPIGSASDGASKVVGSMYAVDASASTLRVVGICLMASGASSVTFTVDNTTAAVNPAIPFTWANSDILRINFVYEV